MIKLVFMVSLHHIQQHREEIRRIASAHGAEKVWIFGSVAAGRTNASSDLDLLVRMRPDASLLDRIALMQELEALLGIKVDAVNENALHPSLRQTILQESIPL